MKERPILFSTPMIQAILDDRKTQTRRVVKEPKALWKKGMLLKSGKMICPYGKPGDILWVRETWCNSWNINTQEWDVMFKASEGYVYDEDGPVRWKPSIHMPKSAARIWLEITDVRVQRLQDITEEDAIAEGVKFTSDGYINYIDHEPTYFNGAHSAKKSFQTLWDSINGKSQGDRPAMPWSANPWVWAITFKVLSTKGNPHNL